ncbi:hypothetical protein FHX78_129 [Streptomyces capillispiralis]|uniref:Uncharacterized protein n=2 Tax=Streptomyces capillispiralis TaxID=68182 RepID=A0A561SGN4_9ACTN|nr:hypothetical protein FHX78_129 [Streptomyces capillispiralis]
MPLAPHEIDFLKTEMEHCGLYWEVHRHPGNYDVIQKLATEGYLESSSRWPTEHVVTIKTANEFPQFLAQNGPFGRNIRLDEYGDEELTKGEMEEKWALEESIVQVPAYRFQPDPAPGQPHHVACLPLSKRALDEQLIPKWPIWVHKMAQAIKKGMVGQEESLTFYQDYRVGKHLNRGERLGRRAGDAARRHAIGTERALSEIDISQEYEVYSRKIPADVIYYMRIFTRYSELPEDAKILGASAAQFAGILSHHTYNRASHVVKNYNGNVTTWDPLLAESQSGEKAREVDKARWMFHNLHYALGAETGYMGDNPFRLNHFDMVHSSTEDYDHLFSPRFEMHCSKEVGDLLYDRWGSWLDLQEDCRNGWTPKDIQCLADSLDQAFSKLPLPEQEIVVEWHTRNQDNAHVWKGTWQPEPLRSPAQPTHAVDGLLFIPGAAALSSAGGSTGSSAPHGLSTTAEAAGSTPVAGTVNAASSPPYAFAVVPSGTGNSPLGANTR